MAQGKEINKEIIYKIFISIVIGLIGFFLSIRPFVFLLPPYKFEFMVGLALPMIISLTWGWRYGLLSVTSCLSFQTIWFRSGWESVFSYSIFILWIIWHGWCAEKFRSSQKRRWHPYIVEIPFRIFNTIILYTIFSWIFLAPAPWVPEITSAANMPFVNFSAIGAAINGYIIIVLSSIIIIFGPVRKLFKLKEIKEAIGNKAVGFTAKVKELIHGGYWVDVAGIKCFMPGSLGGLNKLHDFSVLVGKEIVVMPITFSKEKDTLVVSHREYLRTMIPTTIENLNETIKESRIGFVTGTTKFGVFAEFDECLTGLIPKAELTEEFQKSLDDRSIKPGDKIEFWVKEIISDRKIILSQLGPKIDLWDGIDEKYKPMMIAEGKVTKITSYGAFVELEKGISGLIHKSKLKGADLSKGDTINVKIGSVNVSDRKITMNIA